MQSIAYSLLAVHDVLLREFKAFEKWVRMIARDDADVRLLMTTTGVGPIIALTYTSRSMIPDASRNRKWSGAHFGLAQRKYQSGEKDITGRISKCVDEGVRMALYQAAHIMLTKPVKSSALKTWALRLAKRIGMKKAMVALARKLAVIMHHMLIHRTPFNHSAGAAA